MSNGGAQPTRRDLEMVDRSDFQLPTEGAARPGGQTPCQSTPQQVLSQPSQAGCMLAKCWTDAPEAV